MKSRAAAQFRLFLRMIAYTVAWSIVVSLVIGANARSYQSNDVVTFAKIGALFGTLLGLIAVLVALLFGEVRNRQRFKLILAVCTSLLPAFLVFVFLHYASAFWVSDSESIYLLAVISILPCVIWFSQIVARQYLREIAPRKRKEKSS